MAGVGDVELDGGFDVMTCARQGDTADAASRWLKVEKMN